MNEIWENIKNYEGYQVSNLGRVKSLERIGIDGRKLKERILKNNVKENNYCYVNLRKDGKTIPKYIHRIVMTTLNPIDGMENLHVDHIDFNTQNNCLDNLRWLNPEENYKRKKINKKIRCIETNVIYESVSEGARAINRRPSTLSNCLRGRSKTCGGFHWQYI